MPRLVVELSAIPYEGLSQHFTSTGSALGINDSELCVTQPVELDCQVYKVNQDVIVQGSLSSAVRLTCSRCAEEFEQPFRVAVDAIYLPMQALSSERAKELEAGEPDVYAYAEPLVDIGEMVRDKLMLSIPLQPHCVVECKGLC